MLIGIIIGVVIIIAIIAATLFYLPSVRNPSSSQQTVQSSQLKTIQIGVLLPLTGSEASVGLQFEQVLKYAQNQANQLLQQLGSNIRIQLLFEDTGLSPQRALQAVQDLYSRGVKLIIGPLTSGELRQIKQFTDQNNMLVISPSSTAPDLAIANDSIFRDVSNDTYQGYAIANIMYEQGIRVAVIIWRGDSFGDGLVKVVNSTFTRLGGKVVLAVRYDPSTTDFSSYVSTLNSIVQSLASQYPLKSIAVYSISFDELADIMQLASQYPLLSNISWYNTGVPGSPVILQNPIAANFAIKVKLLVTIAAPVHTIYTDELNKALNASLYADAYRIYDSFWLYVYSILKVGSDDTSKIKQILPIIGAHFFGASGIHIFDKFGDRVSGIYDLLIVNKTSSGYEWSVYGVYDTTNKKISLGVPPPLSPPPGYLVPNDPNALVKLQSISA
ncbi:MAG: penicillin-binding protein activator [Sulfolobaceae archaeon]